MRLWFKNLLLLSFCLTQGWGAEPAPNPPPSFSLLNLVRTAQPVTLKIGSRAVGEGQIPFGFYTGIVNWFPTAPLQAEAKGFGALTVPFSPGTPHDCPLFILQDGMEKPPGGGEPKPVVKYTKVANAQDRPPHFVDGLNLTWRENLACSLAEKNLFLRRGERTRLTERNGLTMQIKDGPELSLSPSEIPAGFLIIFYETLEGGMAYAVTEDVLIQP